MKRKSYALAVLIFSGLVLIFFGFKKNINFPIPISLANTLWYNQPASVWQEALPVGNGRLGAMIFGRPVHERLQLNDITIWSGKPEPEADRPEAYKGLAGMRKAIPKYPGEDLYVIHLLPALPDKWPAGRIKGVRARGGFELDLEWKNGKLARAVVTSIKGKTCKIRYRSKLVELFLEPGKSVVLNEELVALKK